MATETGQILAELKTSTGLTWDQLAGAIGASSGTYVRKVAAGAKPGRNLDAAVRELMATGQVSVPVPRRRGASGAIARVRAPQETGERSRRPAQQRITTERRQVFRSARGKLGWSQSTGGDDATGRKLLASAGRGGKRVSFRAKVRTADGRTRWVTIGGKGGYRPRDVPRGDLTGWARLQVGKQKYALAGGGEIVDLEVIAE